MNSENDSAGTDCRARCRYLSPKEASRYLADRFGLLRAVPTLATLRTRGGGPAFIKTGRHILYPETSLDEWAGKLLATPLRRSTEDYRTPAERARVRDWLRDAAARRNAKATSGSAR